MRPGSTALAGALALALSAAPRSVSAIELSAFVSTGFPSEQWGTGVGGDLTITLLKLLSFSGELARQGSEMDSSLTSLTGSVLLVAPLRAFSVYGGVGVGGFRQGPGSGLGDSDWGVHRVLIVGVKKRFEGTLVLKAEYRRFHLSGDPPLPLDHRASVGVGLSL
jgi:hypothetical protein